MGIIMSRSKPDCEFRRVFPAQELRADSDDEKRRLTGRAVVFDEEVTIGSGFWAFREVIRSSAFDKTLREYDQRSLWNHDTGKPLGRVSAGTLALRVDDDGLVYDNELGDQTWARDAWESVQRGDVQGMSFGFRVVRDTWTEDNEDPDFVPLREVLEAQLFEVSPVTFPAYESTSVDARAVLEDAETRGLIHNRAKDQSPDETTPEPEVPEVHPDRSAPDDQDHSEAGPERMSLFRLRQKQAELELSFQEWQHEPTGTTGGSPKEN